MSLQHGVRAVGRGGLLVAGSLLLDHHVVMRRGCINMDQESGRRRAACTECYCQGKVS